MPELPDIVVYIDCLRRRVTGRPLERVRVAHPFLVRTFDPPLDSSFGKTVRGLRRLGNGSCSNSTATCSSSCT